MFAVFLCMASLFAPSLPSYSLTVEGLPCFAYSYSELDSEKPLLVLIHGSPGDYSGWGKYLKDSILYSKYRILALDRPGFGQSVKEGVLAFPDLEFQAKVVRKFCQKFAHNQPVVVVGHSVGCPIVAHFAMNYPDEIKALVLLAPAISAEAEQPRWYNRLAAKPAIHKKISHEMQVSQEEMMNLPPQLEKMQPFLSQITCETWLLHGCLDMIAPYPNARYVKKNLSNTKLHFTSYPFQNHFIPWTKFDDVKKLLLDEILP
jgi:esterase/lipase